MVEFLLLVWVCIFVFHAISHIDDYFGFKEMMSEEQRNGFTFFRFTINELKRHYFGTPPKY